MDPRSLAADLDVVADGLGRAAGELAAGACRLGRAALGVAWTGHAADAALAALAADVLALAGCVAATDRAARALRAAAADALAVAGAARALP